MRQRREIRTCVTTLKVFQQLLN